MQHHYLTWIILLIIAWLHPVYGSACTSFYVDHQTQPVHGANFDWHDGSGYIIKNKRGVKKVAMSDPAKRFNAAIWTSKFGSVTFNRYGCDWPWGGMNEAGLSCSTMLLQGTKYPEPDSRPSIFWGQWLQYQLDNSASVKDVLESNTDLRIRETRDGAKGIHYFFSDRQGDCAVIEFIDGKFVIYNKEILPIKALANDKYEMSVAVVKKFNNFERRYQIPTGNISYMRFLRIANKLKEIDPKQAAPTVNKAFSLLDDVSYKLHSSIHTQWSVVFDIQNQSIWYLTRNQITPKKINLSTIDFSCELPIEVASIGGQGVGKSEGEFVKLTYSLNRTMVEKAFINNQPQPVINKSRLDRVVKYPDTFVCQQ